MSAEYTCHNEECEHEFEVDFTPETPDTGMSGPWENAEQGEAAYTEPSECPKCGTEVDVEEVAREFEE